MKKFLESLGSDSQKRSYLLEGKEGQGSTLIADERLTLVYRLKRNHFSFWPIKQPPHVQRPCPTTAINSSLA